MKIQDCREICRGLDKFDVVLVKIERKGGSDGDFVISSILSKFSMSS